MWRETKNQPEDREVESIYMPLLFIKLPSIESKKKNPKYSYCFKLLCDIILLDEKLQHLEVVQTNFI
jgi:hypothetical protein